LVRHAPFMHTRFGDAEQKNRQINETEQRESGFFFPLFLMCSSLLYLGQEKLATRTTSIAEKFAQYRSKKQRKSIEQQHNTN